MVLHDVRFSFPDQHETLGFGLCLQANTLRSQLTIVFLEHALVHSDASSMCLHGTTGRVSPDHVPPKAAMSDVQGNGGVL